MKTNENVRYKKIEGLESKVFDFSSWGNGTEICPK
jgi:hypothetical protein